MGEQVSERSYGISIALCGVFGILGIHHFYLGNYWHGLADIGLVVLAIWCLTTGNEGLALVTILVDSAHTLVAFYLLIVEKWRDGDGLRVVLKT